MAIATRNSQLATKSGGLKQAVNNNFYTPCEDKGSINTPKIPSQARDVKRLGNKKGFSLVELSIVIIIVGLLIGGTLVGKSLIESGKVYSTISQIQQFDAAVMSFKSKYKGIPGDSAAFGGDGDGWIEGYNAITIWNGAVNAHCGEISNFWAQLIPGQYARGTYPSGGAGCTDALSFKGANKSAPAAKIGRENSGFYVTADGVNEFLTANSNNYYLIISSNNAQIAFSIMRIASSYETVGDQNKTLKPIELKILDQKIDDGAANTGFVRSGQILNNDFGYASLASGISTCSTGENYLITNSGYECIPFIRIGAQTGDPL